MKHMPVLSLWSVTLFSLLLFGYEYFWFFGLFDHFRFHYILVCFLTCIVTVWFRFWKQLGLTILLAGFNIWIISPWQWQSNPISRNAASNLTNDPSLIWFNVNTSNLAHEKMIQYLTIKNPEVIILSEVNQRWLHSLSPLKEAWKYQILHPREDNFGMAIYSRIPFKENEVLEFESFEVPAIHFKCEFPSGQNITIIAVHPVPPIGSAYTKSRDEYLLKLNQYLPQNNGARLIVGDFNATPWHPPVRQLLHDQDLLYYSPASWFLKNTWPSSCIPFGIPIDLCLADRELNINSVHLGPALGSDHRSLEVFFDAIR